MKTRTIEELHDKYVGHKKFAKVCDIIVAKHYQITDIKEFNEKFKFSINGVPLEFSKQWKTSAMSAADYIIETYKRNAYVYANH